MKTTEQLVIEYLSLRTLRPDSGDSVFGAQKTFNIHMAKEEELYQQIIAQLGNVYAAVKLIRDMRETLSMVLPEVMDDQAHP